MLNASVAKLIPNQMRLRSAVAVALCLAAVMLTGCMPSLVPAERIVERLRPTLPSDDAENILAVDLAALSPVELGNPLWVKRYPGTVDIALHSSGERLAIVSQPGSSQPVGFEVVAAGGDSLWQQRYVSGQFERLAVDLVSERMLAAAVRRAGSGVDTVDIFDAAGKKLWERSFNDLARLVVANDGRRLAALPRAGGEVRLLDADSNELGRYAVSGRVGAAFYGADNFLLINDADTVRLIGADGKVAWSHNVGREIQREVAMSPDGNHIALTTRGSDSTVYVFDTKGRLLWSRPLFLGGGNQPAFDLNGEQLYVYNVGENGGLYGFDAATGQVTLRVFPTTAPAARAAIRNLVIANKALIINYEIRPGSDAPAAGPGPSPQRALIFVDRDGQRLRRLALDDVTDFRISADGQRLLLARRRAAAGQSPAHTELTFFDLNNLVN